MRKGKVLMLLALLVSFTVALPAHSLAEREPQVSLSLIIDNGLVELGQPLLLENGRILISLADLVKLFDVNCEKQGEDGIILKKESVRLTLLLGKNMAVAATEESLQVTRLDVPPRLVRNVLYLPLRFIAESFGAEVTWDKRSGCVLLTTANATAMEGTNVAYTVLSRRDLQAENELSAWYEKHHRTKGLYSLTINDDTYVLLCAGTRPTGGYSVRIESATATNANNLLIAATLVKPGPQDMVTMAITYPNALLKFSGRKFEAIDSTLAE